MLDKKVNSPWLIIMRADAPLIFFLCTLYVHDSQSAAMAETLIEMYIS